MKKMTPAIMTVSIISRKNPSRLLTIFWFIVLILANTPKLVTSKNLKQIDAEEGYNHINEKRLHIPVG